MFIFSVCLIYLEYFHLGRQSRSDREQERHRALMERTSAHHSPSPRDQFVHDQQKFLNNTTGSGTSKTTGNPRSPSGNDVLDELLFA